MLLKTLLVGAVATIAALVTHRWLKGKEILSFVAAAVLSSLGSDVLESAMRSAATPVVEVSTKIQGENIAIAVTVVKGSPERIVLDYIPKCWIVGFTDSNLAASGRTVVQFQGFPRPPFTENRMELEISSVSAGTVMNYALTCRQTGAPIGTGHDEDDRYSLNVQWKYGNDNLLAPDSRFYLDDSKAPPQELEFSVGELHQAKTPPPAESLNRHPLDQHLAAPWLGEWPVHNTGELTFTYSIAIRARSGRRDARVYQYPLGTGVVWPAKRSGLKWSGPF